MKRYYIFILLILFVLNVFPDTTRQEPLKVKIVESQEKSCYDYFVEISPVVDTCASLIAVILLGIQIGNSKKEEKQNRKVAFINSLHDYWYCERAYEVKVILRNYYNEHEKVGIGCYYFSDAMSVIGKSEEYINEWAKVSRGRRYFSVYFRKIMNYINAEYLSNSDIKSVATKGDFNMFYNIVKRLEYAHTVVIKYTDKLDLIF